MLLLAGISAQILAAQTINFSATGTGSTGTIQQYIVPSCGMVQIDAYGAQGGNTNGGLGAHMKGSFVVSSGDTLFIVVGQQGVVNNCGGSNASSGGGGGSFVWKNSGANRTLLIVAGGGGGGNMNWSGGCINGIDAVITQDGTQGNGPTSAIGGIGGNGGSGNAPSGVGSGGAGWLSDGENSTYGTGCTGGLTYPFFTGGDGSVNFGFTADEGDGGFGGGGGAVCGNGGGGGYSGGGGGEGASCRAGGGGGGSYNSGTNQLNTPGVQTGNGAVTLNLTLSTGNNNILSATLVPDDTVCAGTTVTATAANGTAFNWNNGITDGLPFIANNSMSLQLTGIDTLGCADTVNIQLQVNPLPTISFSVLPNDTVCSGTSVTASGTGGNSYTWTNGITDNSAFTALNSSSYIVTGTDINGCTNTSTLNLTVHSNPTVNLGGTIVQANPPAILDAGTGFASYNWSNSQTTQTISVNTNGSYWVTASDANGCNASDTVDVFFTAGIDGQETTLSNVKIYPNPTSDIINITFDNLKTDKLIVEIFDINGRCIYSKVLGKAAGAFNYAINLAEFNPGNYTVRLTSGNSTGSVNIIKK